MRVILFIAWKSYLFLIGKIQKDVKEKIEIVKELSKSLIGKIKTRFEVKGVKYYPEFQSFIGKIQTVFWKWIEVEEEEFQPLISKIQTKDGGPKKPIYIRSFDPS